MESSAFQDFGYQCFFFLESAYLISLPKGLEIVSRFQAFNVATVPMGSLSLSRVRLPRRPSVPHSHISSVHLIFLFSTTLIQYLSLYLVLNLRCYLFFFIRCLSTCLDSLVPLLFTASVSTHVSLPHHPQVRNPSECTPLASKPCILNFLYPRP